MRKKSEVLWPAGHKLKRRKTEAVTLATHCHSYFLLWVHKTTIHIGVPFCESKIT